jgi:REP-associated tyrosine transposase
MSHTYSQNVIHIVFSTKDRRRTISPELRPRLWAYATGICQKLGVEVHAIGGTADHIHLLLQVPPSLAVAKAVLTIKSNSSKWARELGYKFAWQDGYGAFSVSSSIMPAVVRYVLNQEAHHKKMNFEGEFVALLKKHGLDFDAKFVFG